MTDLRPKWGPGRIRCQCLCECNALTNPPLVPTWMGLGGHSGATLPICPPCHADITTLATAPLLPDMLAA